MARKPPRIQKEPIRRKGKTCQFCKEDVTWIDYKDLDLLRRFMSDRGKIRARRVTGNCAQHQRDIAVAIKTSREVALLPYTQRTTSERTGRSRSDSGRGSDQPGDDVERSPEATDGRRRPPRESAEVSREEEGAS